MIPDELAHIKVSIVATVMQSCGLNPANGQLRCWGRSSQVPDYVYGVNTQVAVGGRHHCQVRAGIASCKGNSWYGQLGDQYGMYANHINNHINNHDNN